MSIVIEDDFKTKAKKHLRILHDEDDTLIEGEIQAGTAYIYETLMLIPQNLEDDSVNPDYPTSTNDFSDKVSLAVLHILAMYRSNPDERTETKNKVINRHLIEQILGSELGYPAEY